jgi:HAMP domain-containing protein
MEFAIAVGVVYFIVRMRLLGRWRPPATPIEIVIKVVIEPPLPPRGPPLDPVPWLAPELNRIVREARRHRGALTGARFPHIFAVILSAWRGRA